MFDQHRPTTNLVVNFDRLNVFPLLNGLGQVHHAQRHLHLADLVMLGKSVIVKDGENKRLVKSFTVWKLKNNLYQTH